jgi:hypothetical protein
VGITIIVTPSQMIGAKYRAVSASGSGANMTTSDFPSWAWAIPLVVIGVLRPRLLFAIVRGIVMLCAALVLAVFAGVCL